MNMPMSNDPELDALLGAYALDALDVDERARVDAYLEANPRAREEVDELRESAASLALASLDDTSAPPELWERIAGDIGEPGNVTSLASRRRFTGRLGTMLAVAASILVVVLAAQVVVLSGRDTDGSLEAAYEQAVEQEGAREIMLTRDGGPGVARVVLLPDGSGYLKNEGLQALSPEQTYQLWAVTGEAEDPLVLSAGILGADPDIVAFHTTGPLNALGVTIEQVPGVITSEQPLYAAATLA